MSLSWSAPPAADHNGQLTGYTIKVKDQFSLTTDSTCTSKEVDGLKPNTEYIFEVSAMTAAGSGISTSITHRTTEEGKMAYYDNIEKAVYGTSNIHVVPRPLP